MFDNPIIKSMLMTVLKKFLAEQKIHGVYIYLDEKGEAQIENFKNKPKNE